MEAKARRDNLLFLHTRFLLSQTDCFLCHVEKDYYDHDGEWESPSKKCHHRQKGRALNKRKP